MERNCETCSKFPNCKSCINESEYADKANGGYVVLYIIGTLVITGIILGIFIING